MSTKNTNKADNGLKLTAIFAVALFVLSLGTALASNSSAEQINTADTANTTKVVYDPGTPTELNGTYNNDTFSPEVRTVTYHGNIISTEYNPQVWEYDTKWYGIIQYAATYTTVFTGWSYRTAENTYEAGYDPGDVLTYKEGKWYVGNTAKELYTTTEANGVQTIYVKATWGKITNVQTGTGTSYANSGTMYTNFHLVDGTVTLTGTPNALNNATIRGTTANARLNIGNSNNAVNLSGNTIIDGIELQIYANTSSHGDGGHGLFAKGHTLILGEGLKTVFTGGRDAYNQGDVYGGDNGGTINGNAKVILHSGVYSSVSGASLGGTVNGNTALIIKSATVIDTLLGAGAGYCTVNGNSYVYATGLKMYGDQYEEDYYDDGVINNSFAGVADSRGTHLKMTESTIFTGGSNDGSVRNTFVYLSGDSSVWDLQASGRREASRVTESSNVDVSGNAVIKHVLCGSITDGIHGNRSADRNCAKVVNLSVRGNAQVSSVFGAGFDTFYEAQHASMYGAGSSITVNIVGGTVGYVYGGGYRGTVGTDSNPLDSVNINILGGTILGDVFGGGRGGVDKTCHNASNGSNSWSDSWWDFTGTSKIYTKSLVVNVTGGTVFGNVYGGGESVPGITGYSNYRYGSGTEKIKDNVAAVIIKSGDVENNGVYVNVNGATVMNSVYGGGKGIDTQSEYAPYIVTIKDGAIRNIPWMNGNSGTNYMDVSAASVARYADYAKITGNVFVTIGNSTDGGSEHPDAGTTINGSVYGGGALGIVTGSTAVNVLSGTVDESVYGGGLGTVGKSSVSANTAATVENGLVSGSVFGGSAYGITGGSAAAAVNGGTISGDVYGGGLGESGYVSVSGNSNVTMAGGTVGGSVFGGSAYGIVNGQLTVRISDGYVTRDVYGGGLGRVGVVSTKDKRTVYITGGTIGQSVFGGSSVGDDADITSSISTDDIEYSGNVGVLEVSTDNNFTATLNFDNALKIQQKAGYQPFVRYTLMNADNTPAGIDISGYLTGSSPTLTYSGGYYKIGDSVIINKNLYSDDEVSGLTSGYYILATAGITQFGENVVLGAIKLVEKTSVFPPDEYTVTGGSTSVPANNASGNVSVRYVPIGQQNIGTITFGQIGGITSSSNNTTKYYNGTLTVYKTLITPNKGVSDDCFSYNKSNIGYTDETPWYRTYYYDFEVTLDDFTIMSSAYDGWALQDGSFIKVYVGIKSGNNTIYSNALLIYPDLGTSGTATVNGVMEQENIPAITHSKAVSFDNILIPGNPSSYSFDCAVYDSSDNRLDVDANRFISYTGTVSAGTNAGYKLSADNFTVNGSLYNQSVNGTKLGDMIPNWYIRVTAAFGEGVNKISAGDVRLNPKSITYNDSDALVVIQKGTIGNSVYGGGFMGNTFGNTAVYLGYTYDGSGLPVANAASETPLTISIGDSVYAGGDVGESTSPFTIDLVHGDGRIYINGSNTNIAIPGAIMGSGNSCLTAGETSVELWYYTDPSEMYGIHRADTVLLYASVLDISGRYAYFGDMTKLCSMSHIGVLQLQAGSSLFIDNPMEDVAQMESLTREGYPTTTSSPFNKIIFTQGSTLFIRDSDDGVTATYGAVIGYTILSVADNAPFGGYVLGSTTRSTGGFVVLRDGSYTVADYDNYANDVKCWFINGIESKVLTLSLPYGDGTQKTTGSVDLIKLQADSVLEYTGGTFISTNDAYGFDRPGTCTGDNFGLMFGYPVPNSTTALVSEKVHYLGMSSELMSWKHSTFFLEDELQVDESGYTGYIADNEAYNGILAPVKLLTGTCNGNTSPTPMDAVFTEDENGRAGAFTLNLQFCGQPVNKTDYLGYVLLYIQEVKEIEYITSEGTDTLKMVSNRIELRVDLYITGEDINSEATLTLYTVGGVGETSYLFNTGRINHSVYLLSSEFDGGFDQQISVHGIRNVGNTTGWKDTAPIITVGNYNTGQNNDAKMMIGTLNGGYMGTVEFSVTGFNPAGYNNENPMHFTVYLLLYDSENSQVSQIKVTITLIKRPDITVTFFDYDHGVTPQTGGVHSTFRYGTTLSEADCPPVQENFIGWYTDEHYINVYTFNTPLVRDIELYARYTYTVTFDYQTGSTSQMYVASTNEGSLIYPPDDPTRAGYTFAGWYKQSACIEQWNFQSDRVNGDVTLYAKWVGISYLIEFEYSNGSEIKTLPYEIIPFTDISSKTAISKTAMTNSDYTYTFTISGWDRSAYSVGSKILLDLRLADNVFAAIEFTVVEGTTNPGTQTLTINARSSANLGVDYTGNIVLSITGDWGANPAWKMYAGDGSADLTGPFVKFGDIFGTIDIQHSIYLERDITILDRARSMIEAELPEETFIKWTATAVNGQTVAIYADSILNETLVDPEDTGGVRVIRLTAITSKIAVQVVMEAVTTDLPSIVSGDTELETYLTGKVNTTDLSATVASPAVFLIYPDEVDSTDTEKYFVFTLNDATRSGWSLYGWHNTHVKSEYSTYPAAGLSRTIKLTIGSDGSHTYVMKEELKHDGDWFKLIEYDDMTDTNRLDNPAAPYTIRYIALWEQIEYTVSISNTAHGIIDAYYIDSDSGAQTPGTTFHLHYGDRIKLVFTPEDRYEFYRWTYYGECEIEDITAATTTLVVTGDAIIYASDTGERVVRLYASFDGDDDNALETMYFQDLDTHEMIEIPRNKQGDEYVTDIPGNAMYRAYIVPGTYAVCIVDRDDVYIFGTAVVGSGETSYYYTIHTVELDIKNAGGVNIGIGSGIISYTKYIGKESSAAESLYGSITVAEGYTYELNQGYITENVAPEDAGNYDGYNSDLRRGYSRVTNLGNDEIGILADKTLDYELSRTVTNTRIIWGTVSPITFTVHFVVGKEEGDTSWVDSEANPGIEVSPELSTVTISYGEKFSGKLHTAEDISYTQGTTNGDIADLNYAVYNWYLRYNTNTNTFEGAVYGSTTLNAAFIDSLKEGELVNNSFTVYSWIIKNVNEIKITYVVKQQDADLVKDGDIWRPPGYTKLDPVTVEFISISTNTYTGMFGLPAFSGFKTYTEMGYEDASHWSSWMTITPSIPNSLTNISVTVSGTDVLISFNVVDGVKPTVNIEMTYDRMTTVIYADVGTNGDIDSDLLDYLLNKRGWVRDSDTLFHREARFDEVIYAPLIVAHQYYEFGGWEKSGGTGNVWEEQTPEWIPSGMTTYAYKVTQADVDAHKAQPSEKITFSAIYIATTTFALTFITPIGTFQNGHQRRTVYLTPSQLIDNTVVEIPQYNTDYYTWRGWTDGTSENPIGLPNYLTYDLEVIGLWTVHKHTLTFNIDSGSSSVLHVSATHDSVQHAATSGGQYNHHSEIIFTVVPNLGYTIDLASTLASVTGGVNIGEPTFISDEAGFRWSFFLDSDVSITFYATEVTVPVYLIVNGSLWKTFEATKYSKVYFDTYSSSGYSSSSGWYTDLGCTQAYTEKETVTVDGETKELFVYQVISEMTFYTTVEPNTYYIVYHPNNGTTLDESTIRDAIEAYRADPESHPLEYIQEVTYGTGFSLLNKTYTWDGRLFSGWSMVYGTEPSLVENIYKGRITNLKQEIISEDLTVDSYSSSGSIYGEHSGIVHMYGYYVRISLPTGDDAKYDGTGKYGQIVKETYDADDRNLTVYYSDEILNSVNYNTAGSTSAVPFIDAGDHMTFYYGWVNVDGQEENRSYFQGAFTVSIAKRQISLTSGSATRAYIVGTPLYNETVTIGGDGIVTGEEDGLSFVFTYEDSDGARPVAIRRDSENNVIAYRNTFNIIFDGVRIKSTNYTYMNGQDSLITIGSLLITESSALITIETVVNKTYGDPKYTMEWSTVDKPAVTYESGNESIVTVDSNGTLTILSAGTTTIHVALVSDATKSVDVQVIIAQKALTVTVSLTEDGKTYDGTTNLPSAPSLTYVSGLVDGDEWNSGNDSNVSFTVTGRYSDKHAGTQGIGFTFTPGNGKSSNYTIDTSSSTIPASGVIAKRDLTITTLSATKVFDNAPLTAGYTVEGFVSGESFRSVSVTGTRTNVGSETNTLGGLEFNDSTTRAEDYNVIPREGTLTVTVRTESIPAERTYVYTGDVMSSGIFTTTYYEVSGTTSAKPIGEYSVTATLLHNESVTNVQWEDGSTTPKVIRWFIVNQVLNSTWLDISKDTYTYDGTDHRPTVTYIGPNDVRAYVEGTDYTVSYPNCRNASTSETSTYVLVTGIGGYSGTLYYYYKIAQVTIDVTANVLTYTYDGTAHTLGYTASDFVLDGESVSVTNGTQTDVGNYHSVFSVESDTPTNYKLLVNGSEETGVDWKITKRPVYIIASSAWKMFDGAALSSSGYEAWGILDADSSAFDIQVSGNITDIGIEENEIICTINNDTIKGNYQVIALSGTLVVVSPDSATVAVSNSGALMLGAPAVQAVVSAPSRRWLL